MRCDWGVGGDAEGPLRKPVRRKVPPERCGIAAMTGGSCCQVGACRPSYWVSEYGVEGKGFEERSLDSDKQSFIGNFRLNSGHLFSKCQGHIYLI